MNVNSPSVSPQKITIRQKIAQPFKKVGKAVKKAVHSVDKYTSPREGTAAEFKKASYFQACWFGVGIECQNSYQPQFGAGHQAVVRWQ